MDIATDTFESLFRAMPRSMFKRRKREALLKAHPLFARFFELAWQGSLDERRQLLNDYPVFLSMSIMRCVAQVEELLDPFLDLFEGFGIEIRAQGNQMAITTHDDRYPVGTGPIEGLWSAVDQGTLTPEQAVAEASQAAMAGRLSSIYVSALSRANLSEMRQGRFQRAAWRQRVLMVAVESIDPARTLANGDDGWAMRKWAGAAWVEIATAAFTEMADLRTFAHAVRTADALIEQAGQRSDAYLGRILLRKAILFLDPFHVGRPFKGYPQAIERWTALGREAVAADRVHPMPDPYMALQDSIGLFRSVIEFGIGFDKLVCYCAFAQALYRARSMDAPIDLGELREVVATGLELAKAAQDAARSAYLAEIADAIATQQTPRRVHLADLEMSTLLVMDEVERLRVEGWKAQLDAVADTAAPLDLSPGPLPVWRELPEDLPEAQRRAVQVLLASVALAIEREGEGLEILGEERRACENHPPAFVDAIRWLCGFLALNAGASEFERGRFGDALRLYFIGLHVSSSMNLPGMRSSCLARVLDLVRAPHAQVDLMVALYNYGLAFEGSMSTIDLWNLQEVHRLSNAVFVHEGHHGGAHIGALWQLSKGLRFATVACRGMAELTPLFGAEVEPLAQALQQALASERTAGPSEDGLHGDILLLGYAASVLDAGDGTSPPPGPRARYDRMLEAALVNAASESRRLPHQELPLLGDAAVQEALGPCDVLANFYLGQSLSRQLTIYLMLVTREGRRLAAISAEDLPNVSLQLGEAVTHPLALAVASVRRRIQADPAVGDAVAPEALAELQTLFGTLFSGFDVLLDQLRAAGKTHLCIVPHGPLHHLPFHLLGSSSGPLADRWVVTCLPNLALLKLDARRPRGAIDRPGGVSAFACGRWASPAYPALPDAVKEATAIAGLFGVLPLLEGRFDRAHVFDTLCYGPRYLHISGHGEMDVEAPCFHHLLMAPRDGKDVKLHAYELQGLDLRGVELVTLASCQTGLGRFDISDNLRGLPAFLFQCGVSAIVATLWDVESTSATTFFTALYEVLKQSDDRLEAFAHAQRVTRERHPEYRDWGAFCYLGDWSRRDEWSRVRSVPGIPGLRWTAPSN